MNLDDKKSLLIIIDVQEKLVPVINNKDEIVNNIEIISKIANIMNIPIVCTEQYPKGLGRTLESISINLRKDMIFSKISFNSYTGNFKKYIKSLDIKDIIVVGMETHICVYQTCRELVKDGYNVHVVKDAVGSRSIDNYKNGLYLLNKSGAIITNLETTVFDWLKVAGDKKFRNVLKLIK